MTKEVLDSSTAPSYLPKHRAPKIMAVFWASGDDLEPQKTLQHCKLETFSSLQKVSHGCVCGHGARKPLQISPRKQRQLKGSIAFATWNSSESTIGLAFHVTAVDYGPDKPEIGNFFFFFGSWRTFSNASTNRGAQLCHH